METPTLDQLALTVEAQQKEIDELRSGLAVRLEAQQEEIDELRAGLASKVEARQKEVDEEIDELRTGLDYAVYGIGNPHPDPRDQGEPVKE